MQQQNDSYQRGWQRLREVDDAAGEAVVAGLQSIAPDLARHIIEFGFGEVYSRPGLSLRQRELATIAALAAIGHAQPQLKVHLHAALNVGLTQEEITETLQQMCLYAGFPAALNAVFAARDVFQEHVSAAIPLAPMPVVRCFLEGLRQGTLREELLADAVEWHIPGDPARVPWVGHCRGRAAVREVFALMAHHAEPLRFEVERWFDTENEVLVRGRFAYRYRSGKEYAGSFVMSFVVVDGLIERYEIFEDSWEIAEALQA
jgi:alkylhydroperoxidase/carboxymuconolactone decarboxylase family protein YurZ/ketosteroid isomerase-like protein